MKRTNSELKTKESSHKVDIVVTIEKAVLYPTDGPKEVKKRSVNPAKAQHFFHTEYRLLPTDVEATKADVVTFGSAAKVYTDSDSKVMRSWREGDLVYFSWSQKRRIEITMDLLTALFSHRVDLQIWNSKDKVSARARFDRPKALRSPQQPLLPSRTPSAIAPIPPQPEVRKSVQPPSPSPLPPKERLIKSSTPDSVGSIESPAKEKKKKGKRLKLETEKETTTLLAIPLAKLFVKNAVDVEARLERPVGPLQDARILISIGGTLMDEKQRKALNPMAICIRGATGMPDFPINWDELQRRCLPAYAQYRFYDQPVYKTIGCPQNRELLWEDVGVVLVGSIDLALLVEWLCGPPFVVEIHDRDRIFEGIKAQPVIFGDLESDEDIGTLTHSEGKTNSRRHSPYCVCTAALYRRNKIDSRSLQGALETVGSLWCSQVRSVRIIERGVPSQFIVSHLELPSTELERRTPQADRPSAATSAESQPTLAGNYLDAGSELKLKIELSYPLVASKQGTAVASGTAPVKCPFSRLVFAFPTAVSAKTKRLLLESVSVINAAALGLDNLPQNVAQVALSTYKLSSAQKSDPNLDVVTGFQVVDPTAHIIVLEGLHRSGIRKIWNSIPHPQPEDDDKFYRVLHNSSLVFSKRLYADLDVDLCVVQLHKPVADILAQPIVYVKDVIPQLCLQALINLDKMSKAAQLIDVSRNELFPSAEMILALGREFGVTSLEKVMEETDEARTGESKNVVRATENRKAVKTSRLWTPISNRNFAYEQALAERKTKENPNYLKQNILHTRTENTRRRPPHVRSKSDDSRLVAYNYSSQALNSTELAKNRLRRLLGQEPGSQFTYCQDFNTMTMEPAYPTWKEELHQWGMTAKREFIYPGPKTSLESNQHPGLPDEARKEELQQPWEENLLHMNKLKPTVERMRFSWPQRREDMDLLTKPMPFFGQPMPVGVHSSSGDEDDNSSQPPATDFKTHRLLAATELTSSGRKSSNQLDRLKDILKDPPSKLPLRGRNGVPNVPPLSVITEIDDERETMNRQGYHPGPFEGSSWTVEKNLIPIAGRNRRGGNSEHLDGFRLWHRSFDPVHKRPVEPLSDEERQTHLFQRRRSVEPPC
ncbi:uncharacterized protein [Oscarella lobularis]|uniref:uncharacterized protein isoform X2 n=1 Tax=Oscarella lobularis TaxID=121494 RepID=UPI0033142FD8